MSMPVNAHPEHSLTEQQIRRVLEGLDALPPLIPISDALKGTILVDLGNIKEYFIAYTQGDEAFTEQWKAWEVFGFQPPPMTPRPLDWNIVYRRMNEFYVALQEPPPRETFQALVEATRKLHPVESRHLWLPFDVENMNQVLSSLDSFEEGISEFFIAGFVQSIPPLEEASRRSQCAKNMQRLSLAMMLYRLEHGTMLDENWVAQIKPYLGDGANGKGAEQYFSCPSNPSPEGHTTYALVLYGNDVPLSHETILLIELKEPVALSEAIVSVDEVLALFPWQHGVRTPHPGGMNTARQSGAVLFMSQSISVEELSRLLGR